MTATTTPCNACHVRGKTWNGDDPKCAFLEGPFSTTNWNCATVGEVRELAEREDDCRIHHRRPENQNYATIDLMDFNVLPYEDEKGFIQAQPVCLWVGWYKSRGATEALWLMFETAPPRPPTEAECLAIIEHYKPKVKT
jgi:hypothetical protein